MKLWKTGLLALALFSLAPGAVLAGDLVQGFASTQTLQPGIIVALDKSQTDTVEPATAGAVNAIYGVVVDPSDAPLTLNGQHDQVFVANSGTYQVFVSTQGGVIKPGDYITVSTLDGIGQKASSRQSTILGRAQGSFDGINNVISNSSGTAIGRVPVTISIEDNPLATPTFVPLFLKRTAASLADKPVSPLRIYMAAAVLLVAAVAAITILWSGIRGSMVSLGRNPLSRPAIMSGMYKVILTGVCVFVLGLAGVYLVLKI